MANLIFSISGDDVTIKKLAKFLHNQNIKFDYDKNILFLFADYFKNNTNKIISTKNLRDLKFINNNKFSLFFKNNIDSIKNILSSDGYILENYKNKGNSKFYICKKSV